MSRWTFSDIPDQSGRTAVVTGANTGIGYETAKALALKGANVIIASRNAEKGESAAAKIRAEGPGLRATFQALDLADLDSVRAFSTDFKATHQKLDLLVLNAGVMVPPFSRTKQGFELQLGTNHLGHFALTGQLMPILTATPASRVVVVYSSAHRMTDSIDLTDPAYERRPYKAWKAYSESKLANVLFALELEHRLQGVEGAPRVTAAHPGWTATDLQRTAGMARFFNPLFAMKAPDGALPTLRAATAPDAESGSHFGPARFFEMNGPPVPVAVSKAGKDRAVAAELWELSERLTGVHFELRTARAA